jgi:cyclophilin family peptidyl-prolyl cis-trans isomerase
VKRVHMFFVVSMVLILSVVTSGSFAANSLVSLNTNYGPIVIELYDDAAPITVANFLSYVNSGFYDGLVVHRTYGGRIVQAGAFDEGLYTADYSPPFDLYASEFYHAPNAPIVLEVDAGLSNLSGTIAMARSTGPDTATSQFFINVSNNSLDFDPSEISDGYAVFGEVVGSMFPAEAIAYTYTIPSNYSIYNYFQDLPVIPAVIESARVVQCITYPQGDLNSDCYVNLLDLAILAEHWLERP